MLAGIKMYRSQILITLIKACWIREHFNCESIRLWEKLHIELDALLNVKCL